MSKSLLILGATSDMSKAIARKYAGKGYNLVLAARKVERLEPLSSDIKQRFQTEVTLKEFDALDVNSHKEWVAQLGEVPTTTICVFGLLGDQEKAQVDQDERMNILNTNYTGAVSILSEIASVYEEKKSGCIIGISSVAGERGRQSNYYYGSAKAGFTAFLSGLRNRLQAHGIHVMTVNPGFVKTQMTAGLKLPPLITGNPEQVANAIYNGHRRKKNVVYVLWMWRYIMMIIKSIPEFIFKKLKL